MTDARTPTIGEVARVAAMADPVLRNLHITYCYARLSAALAARTGQGNNWCTFATWASRQAGATIRSEDLLDTLHRRLRHPFEPLHPIRSIWRALLRRGLFSPDTRLGHAVREIHTPFDAFERAGAAVARGNLKVFEEIGREFARYLADCNPDDRPDGQRFAAFIQKLSAGDPPEGQTYLRRAFTHLQELRFAGDAGARGELLALANVEIGFHEQTRLQQEIREALDAPLATVRDLRNRVLAALLLDSGAWRRLVDRGPLAALIVRIAAAVRRFAYRLTREVITDCLMVFSLPDGAVVRLGGPLDVSIPEAFIATSNPDFKELLTRLERCEPGRAHSGAQDWSDFPQRMHVILHVFCGFHERRDLLSPPFDEQQVQQILAGELPEGRI